MTYRKQIILSLLINCGKITTLVTKATFTTSADNSLCVKTYFTKVEHTRRDNELLVGAVVFTVMVMQAFHNTHCRATVFMMCLIAK